MTTERHNYFAPGLWNACCMGCGAKLKSDELRKDWQGFMKCQRCWEPRHPQDFVRSRPGAEPAPLPWTRSCSAVFVSFGALPAPSFIPDVVGIGVTFTNTTPEPAALPNTYEWSIDGVPVATTVNLANTFTPGTYDVTLCATNSVGTACTTQEFTFASTFAPLPYTIDLNPLGSSGSGASTALEDQSVTLGTTNVWRSNYDIGGLDPDPPPRTPRTAPPGGQNTYFEGRNPGTGDTNVDLYFPEEWGIYYFSYYAYGSDLIETYITTSDNTVHFFSAASPPSFGTWALRDSHIVVPLFLPIVRIQLNRTSVPGSYFLAADITVYAE